MTELKRVYRKSRFRLGTAWLAWLLTLAACAQTAWAQTPAPQLVPSNPPSTASPASPQNPKSAGEGARATQEQKSAEAGEKKISPKEAQELFHEVDEILKFANTDSGLPLKHSVKRKLTSRDELVAYMTKHMSEDKDAQRLRRSELVLKKFGLLPPEFNLEKFLVAMLREQVAGYYDPKTETVNLLDWVDVDQQRPVLAHELTHALQDQSFGLDKWMKVGDTDLDEKKQITAADIETDEISTARQAVVEGQAMVVLVDYMLAPMGATLVKSPQVVAALKDGMLVGTADSVVFHDAPIYLKESLTFPYRYGLDFEAALLTQSGKQKAFTGAFSNPPRTTRQIMEPQTYLSGERLEPLPVPDFNQIFQNYDRFDVGAIGEFDVAVLVDQYAGADTSHIMYPHWRGGYYYAAMPKGDPSAPLGLLYVSRWDDAEKAAVFAGIYAKALNKRYLHLHGVMENGKKPADNPGGLETLTGKNTWLTESGPVVIEVSGDRVMVTESLDGPTTEKLEQAVLSVPLTAN